MALREDNDVDIKLLTWCPNYNQRDTTMIFSNLCRSGKNYFENKIIWHSTGLVLAVNIIQMQSSLVYFKYRLSQDSQVERLVYFKFYAPLHAPLFHCHVTLWGALERSEKSGGEMHSVGMATEAVVRTPRDLK